MHATAIFYVRKRQLKNSEFSGLLFLVQWMVSSKARTSIWMPTEKYPCLCVRGKEGRPSISSEYGVTRGRWRGRLDPMLFRFGSEA
jgi:hypothetical protein